MIGEERAAPYETSAGTDDAPVERLDDAAARELAERLESLLARLEALPDELARGIALDAVEALVRLYGEGLARMMERIIAAGDAPLASDIARDELVSHLLVLHDLHPESLDERVRRALTEVRPYLHSQSAEVELVSITDDVAHVRLTRAGQGGALPGRSVRTAVESAVLRAAPELARVAVDGAADAMQQLVTIEGPRRNGARSRPSAEGSLGAPAGGQQPSP